MPEIRKSRRIFTVIDVFTVEPANQPHVVDLLVEAANDVIKRLPGFISNSIHASADGSRVVNYQQWRSRDSFDAMQTNPAVQTAMKSISESAESDSCAYDVVDVVKAAAVSTRERGAA